MAHATEEKQNPQSTNPQSRKPEQETTRPPKGQGEVFEYQKDKPITGEQHGTGSSGNDRASSQPIHKEHHQSPPGGAKR